MYSPRVIEKTLDGFADENGWRPFPHEVEEIEEFRAYIDSLMVSESNTRDVTYYLRSDLKLTQKRKQYIRRFIENEQFMCFADAGYFATRYGRLRTADERIIPFVPRDAQKIFQAILAEFDDLQVAIQLFILKCRQLGVSTVVALYFLHRLLFRSNCYAVMASVQVQQSDKLGQMIETTWKRLPFWLPPAKVVLKDREPKWANGSILSIQSGNQEVGIAQGHTPTCIHISEVGDYRSPKRTLEEGLFPACHPTSALFLVLEGTGSMASPWQKEKWEFYKANWGNGGRFRPIFIPPACARDLYPLPDWLRGNPIPENWNPMPETKRMKHRAELFIRSTDYLAATMGSNWTMGREYMWFWETRWNEAVASHSEKTFLSQYACTDSESFQGKYDSVFADETIEITTKEAERNYVAYAITGKTILIGKDNAPHRVDPDQVDYSLERIPIHWEAPDGNIYDWELVPLNQFNEDNDENFFNKLLIFRYPQKGDEYSLGVDTADGLGMPHEDRSCLSLLLNRKGKERDEQCAEFTSNEVNSPQMARIVAAVAAWYGSYMDSELGVKMAIEQVRKPGDECQHQLKIMGFFHHHRMVMYDGKGMPSPEKATKEGFFTRPWSRPMMLNKFVDAVNTGWLRINSPLTIRQMKTFVRKETSGISRMDHGTGEHDDNIFASGMAYFTAHDMDNNAMRQAKRYEPKDVLQPKIDMRYPTLDVVIP